MDNKKISFFKAQDIKGINPADYLKQIIPGIDVADLDVQFIPINKKSYGKTIGIGKLFSNIGFQGQYVGGNSSNFETSNLEEVLYTLSIGRKTKNSFTEKLGIVKKGGNFVLSKFSGYTPDDIFYFNEMENLAVIPNNLSNKRIIYDLNNKIKILQTTTDIQNGVSVSSNARYSEAGILLNKMVQNLGYGNNGYSQYESSLKSILGKNFSNIEHNNQITIGNIFSHKELGGIEEGFDISSKNYILTKDQFNKLALFDSREEGALRAGIKKGIYKPKYKEEVILKDGSNNLSIFSNNIKSKLGEDVKYYKINIEDGKDVIKDITAIGKSGKEFTFDNFSVGKEKLFSGIQYLRETTSNDSSILYHTIPGESKGEIRDLIATAHERITNKNGSDRIYFAQSEAKKISDVMRQRYAEAHGINITDFKAMGGNKELKAINKDEIEAMILSGRNFDYGHNIGKQSQNTTGGTKRLQGSYSHPLAFLNKEGQRKAQSIDQLSSLNVKADDGSIFDVGREINRIGENIDQLKYKKIEVESAQLNALDQLMKSEYGFGTSYGITNRRAFVLYTNSDFAFQDSNAVSTQVAMAGAGTSDANRINVDYSSLNLNKKGDIFSNEELSRISKQRALDNNNILKDGTLENKIVRNLLGEDNYQKYVSKNEYINEIKGLKNLMPENLDLNIADDRKAYVNAMDLITQKYNEINKKYLIQGNELGRATILSDNIVNDGQLRTITKSNFALIDDISLGKHGIQVRTKNVSLAGEGAKMMNGMVKLTVQNTNHLMGVMNGNDFMPVEMFVNDKTPAKKRGFSGSFITSFLQTAYTHADTYGNKDLNDFDKYLRANGNITYNGKTANVLDILNIGFEKNNGVMTINDKTMTKLLSNRNIFDKNNLPYEDYLKMVSDNIEANIGKITDKDSALLGNLIAGKIEDVYENYIKQFGADKGNMQIAYNNADIYSSNLNLVDDGVTKVGNVGKSYRFINNFVKMNESISRKDMAGMKIGRLSNFVLDEQLQTGLVDMIEGKILRETENKISKVVGLTAFPGTEFERAGEAYKSTFGANAINVSNLDSSVRNVNLPLSEYLEKSPIAKKIMKVNEDGELINEAFGSLTGFDTNTSRKFKNYFDNRARAKEFMLKNYYQTILGDDWNKDKYGKVVGGFGDILSNDNGILHSNSKINYALEKQLKSNLTELGISTEKIEEITKNQEYLSMYKHMYGIEAIMNIKDPSKISQSEYDFLTNITSASDSLKYETINNFTKGLYSTRNGLDKVQTLDMDIIDSTNHFLRNLKGFSGENVFSMLDIKETFMNDTLPFFIDDLAVDAQGIIVYNKELANVEKIANQNFQLSEISKKKAIYNNLLKPLENIENAIESGSLTNINSGQYKKILTETFENMSEIERRTFLDSYGLNLDLDEFKKSFKNGGNLNLKGVNNNNEVSEEMFNIISSLTNERGKDIKKNKERTNKKISEILEKLEFTLKDFSGQSNHSNEYINIKNDYDIIRNVINKIVNGKINNLTDMDAEGLIINRKVKDSETLLIRDMIEKQINKLDKRAISYEEQFVNSIFNRTGDSAEILFKNKGYMYNAPTMRIKNSFALSPREGTGIIDYIANEAEQFMGKGYYNKRYNTWSIDNKNGLELETKFKEFRKALTLLYGDHYASDITQEMLNSNSGYTKDILSKRLNKLSGVAIGTKEQFEKLGMLDFFGNKNYTYQMLSRNPHQYISSLRGTRYVMLDDKYKNLSFFGNYYGNQTKIEGMQNNLLFVGKRTAMASHGDFDGDVFQGLFFSASDFGVFDKDKAFRVNKSLRTKMEYMNILADISERDIESEIKSGKPLKGDLTRLLQLARREQRLDSTATDLDVFNSIKNAYYINKAEYIRTNLELQDEAKKHSVLPELRRAFANLNGEQIEFDKSELSSIIGKMSAKEKLSLFLGSANDDVLKNIDDYIDGSPGVKNYVDRYLTARTDASKSKALLELVGELNDSKDNINWNNASLVKSSYADYTGINRTGIVHSSLSAYRESATIILHKDVFNKKYNLNIAGVNENLTNLVKDTIGLGSISEYIEGIGISAKLGGNTNPYEVLKSFGKIKEDLENIKINNLLKDYKTKELTSILKDNMEVKLKDIDGLKDLLIHGITSEGVIKQMTNGIGVSQETVDTFVKLINLEGKGQDLSEYTGLQVMRGISNFVAIYSNAMLDMNNGEDAINGFKNIVNKENGNLLARMQRIGSTENIMNNLGQNFRVIREAYKKVTGNTERFLKKFLSYQSDNEVIEDSQESLANTITFHTNKISSLSGDLENSLNNHIDNSSLKNIEEQYQKYINELKALVDENKDKQFTSDDFKKATSSLEDEIKRLKDIINSKTDQIKELESQFTSTKNSYQENLNNTIKQMENLKESIKIASENKKAQFIDSSFADNLQGVKKFASNNKLAFTVGGGLAVIGMFLRIFQSNRSVVKLNINEEEYQNEKMPLQRQFGGYEINTNIRSFYR